MDTLPDSIARNVEQWTKNNAEHLDGHAAAAWARDDLTWGVFGIREEDLGSPLGDVRDLLSCEADDVRARLR